MPNNENLNWLLTVNADTGGAEKFNKALKDSEGSLGAVDVATSKTERAMESAGARAAKMGGDVARSTKRYVAELMAAGGPTSKMGEEAAKAHQKGREAAE